MEAAAASEQLLCLPALAALHTCVVRSIALHTLMLPRIARSLGTTLKLLRPAAGQSLALVAALGLSDADA